MMVSTHSGGKNTDQGLAHYISRLSQSLESFEVFKYRPLGPQCFKALSDRGESLVEIKLNLLRSLSIYDVSGLKGCTNLVSLSLSADKRMKRDLDGALMMVAWVKECKKLRNLTFNDTFIQPALMAPILLEDSIRLTSLKLEAYMEVETTEFHRALANQTSLESLWLEGDADHSMEVDVLVASLTQLVNLTDLHLGGVMNEFADRHMVALARSLPQLEVWRMGGYRLPSALWGAGTSLRSLRRLEVGALTATTDGIVDFIKDLGPGNHGLVLSIINTDFDRDLSLTDHDLIQHTMARRVGGRLEYELRRRDY